MIERYREKKRNGGIPFLIMALGGRRGRIDMGGNKENMADFETGLKLLQDIHQKEITSALSYQF